jgi:prepilin-type N-terminal cleavage/methylation domain-containing protein
VIKKFEKYKQGFTLIELLIVIAILGLLAVIVLIAINPAQQLARTRDAGRKSAVSQMGHAMEAYGTSRSGVYAPDDGAGCETSSWAGCLRDAAEISIIPDTIVYSSSFATRCSASLLNDNWCYDSSDDTGQAPVIIYSVLESTAERSRCDTSAGEQAWFVYSTDHGRGGLVCSTTEPAAGGSFTFVD